MQQMGSASPEREDAGSGRGGGGEGSSAQRTRIVVGHGGIALGLAGLLVGVDVDLLLVGSLLLVDLEGCVVARAEPNQFEIESAEPPRQSGGVDACGGED
jgi:hypothetical protein